MASHNSQTPFVFKFGDNRTKSYDNSFPGLTLPFSQNPLEEVGLHKQLNKTLDDLNSREVVENSSLSRNVESFNDTGLANVDVTPKSQKQKPSDVKRWASVVKAHKRLPTELDFSEKNHYEGTELTSDIFDCIFKTFPESFESHKSFIVINDKKFYCNICSVFLDSVLSLSNHLKTRKHEDNAIEFLKTKMPVHLHNTMEFVSFYGSNLCCNLCRCKIPMSSCSPHETIVNIIAHNSNESHIKKKVNRESYNCAETLLQELSKSSATIKDNMHIIEKKLVPEFKCQLCKVVIAFHNDKDVLIKNFITHLNSVGHLKNQKAVEVLKLFGEASISGKEIWAVVNGNIMCTYCNREFETNLHQLISHANDVDHATNVFFKLSIPSSFNKVSDSHTLHENMMNEAKTVVFDEPKPRELEQPFDQSKPGSRLKELLSTMPNGLKDVNYVIENDKGSITCLICNRVVPPSTYNLKTHLLGNKHKMNLELKKPVSVEEPKKPVPDCFGCVSRNPFTTRMKKALPATIRAPKCRQMETIPASVLNHLFSLLLKENQLIKKSESLLVRNVDGKHSYCNLCRALIPLSLDVDILESNLISHLGGKRHESLLSGEKENEQGASNSPKVSRSLFELPDKLHELKKDSQVFNFEDFTRLVFKDSDMKTERDGNKSFSLNHNYRLVTKKPNDEVFIFGKEEIREISQDPKNAKESKHLGQNKSLPVANVARLVCFEEETSEDVLNRRQKQIDYGKNTEGYARYCKLIPRRKRGIYDPVTPPMNLRCSRRTWDGMIRAWRRQLHSWDPPQTSTLDSDIRPLD